MWDRFGRLDTEMDGEPTMDNNSAARPPGTNINVDSDTIPYGTGTWVFPQTTLDFPFLRHIANTWDNRLIKPTWIR